MQYKFKAYGHGNITAMHKTTLEFTKDKDLSLRGDCIIGVNADFSLLLLKKLIKSLKSNEVKIIIKISLEKPILKKPLIKKSIKSLKNNKILKEEIVAEINPDFDSDREMVVRKSDFRDERTFAFNARKSAFDLSREFVDKLKNNNQEIEVFIVFNCQ